MAFFSPPKVHILQAPLNQEIPAMITPKALLILHGKQALNEDVRAAVQARQIGRASCRERV